MLMSSRAVLVVFALYASQLSESAAGQMTSDSERDVHPRASFHSRQKTACPCLNGGECIDESAQIRFPRFVCRCRAPFAGTLCQDVLQDLHFENVRTSGPTTSSPPNEIVEKLTEISTTLFVLVILSMIFLVASIIYVLVSLATKSDDAKSPSSQQDGHASASLHSHSTKTVEDGVKISSIYCIESFPPPPYEAKNSHV